MKVQIAQVLYYLYSRFIFTRSRALRNKAISFHTQKANADKNTAMYYICIIPSKIIVDKKTQIINIAENFFGRFFFEK